MHCTIEQLHTKTRSFSTSYRELLWLREVTHSFVLNFGRYQTDLGERFLFCQVHLLGSFMRNKSNMQWIWKKINDSGLCLLGLTDWILHQTCLWKGEGDLGIPSLNSWLLLEFLDYRIDVFIRWGIRARGLTLVTQSSDRPTAWIGGFLNQGDQYQWLC